MSTHSPYSCLFLVASLGAAAATAAEEIIELEPITVVGSRLESTDINTPSPVLALDRAEIDVRGYLTIGDLVRNLPFNSGNTIGVEGAATGFSSGSASINLRGLGNNNTLVLLNGRRSSPAGASGFDGFQTVFDFNSVPQALIESVQILKDAGSGIYGSDAVAGVVSINLLRRFEGTQVNLDVGGSDRSKVANYGGGLLHGWSDERQSVIVQADARYQERTKYRDLPFSRTGDQRARGALFDQRSTTSFPAWFNFGGFGIGAEYYTALAPTAAPVLDDPSTPAVDGNIVRLADANAVPSYDFNRDEDMFPEVRNHGFYSRWQRDEAGKINPFAELSFRQNLANYEAAPVPMRNTLEQGDGPGGVINLPAVNPYNPFGDATFGMDVSDDFRWRMSELGNRVFDNRSDYARGLFGVGGERPEHHMRWEAAALIARSDATSTTRNTTSDALVQQGLNGTLPGLPGRYLNPFGPSDPGVIDAIRIENTNESAFTTAAFDAFLTARGRELRHGPLRYAAGLEVRREELDDQRSALAESGQIVGGLEGESFRVAREVYAAFAEASVPLAPRLEIRGAGRVEYYSDVGGTAKPKVSLAYKPYERLTLRSSYGGAFLAPSLAHLHTPRLATFSSGLITDTNPASTAFGTQSQVQTNTGGNPDLDPEETEVFSAGFLWQARPDALGLSIEGGWFLFDQKNLLNALDAAFLIENEALFPGRVVRSPAPAGSPAGAVGPIQYVETYFENVDTRTYQGYDLDVGYAFLTDACGRFRIGASATFLQSLKLLENEYAGDYGNPELRGNVSLSWSLRDWGAALFVNHIGAYSQRTALQQAASGDIRSDTRVNVSISHNNVFGWKTTLGVRNLFDTEPPFDGSRAEGYNFNVNSGEPRYYTLALSRRL